MLRYLKYIFLVFGSLALLIIGFFIFQNKRDLKLAWDYWNVLDYEYMTQNCPEAEKQYYYPCFKKEYQEYLDQAGLTGTSIGLKLAFNFMDKDKASSERYENKNIKNIVYSLNYLEINNMAIKNSYRRFYGFKNMYGGYLSSLREFLDGAEKFSKNMIEGLESEEGIASIQGEETKRKLSKRFSALKAAYKQEL
ncbi:MAG: hypothetical protein WD025_03335, partial [Bacteriovoracaceae bacterium]